MKHFLTIMTVLLVTCTAQAQNKASMARRTAKALVLPSPVAAKHLTGLRAAGMHEIAGALELHLTRSMMSQTPDVSLSTLPVNSKTKQRSWVEQKQRDIQAWKLKRQRRKRDEQNRKDEQARQALRELEATLPRENPEHALETSSFKPLLAKNLPTDPLPLLEQPGILYRGMALDSDGISLENILINGLRLQDLGSHATTKLLAISGGMRGTVSSAGPVTNLTSFPDQALYWANQRVQTNKELVVIIKVAEQAQSGEVVLASEDIPADRITQIIAPLNVNGNGNPVWCNIELTPDATFLVTPYDLPPLAKTAETEK